MKKKWPESEEELAKVFLEWISDSKWDIYQEVEFLGRVADIVLLRDNLVWVVECKTSLSLALMEQANSWIGYANYTSILIPRARRRANRGHFFGRQVLKDLGIGVLEATEHSVE